MNNNWTYSHASHVSSFDKKSKYTENMSQINDKSLLNSYCNSKLFWSQNMVVQSSHLGLPGCINNNKYSNRYISDYKQELKSLDNVMKTLPG